MPPKWDSEHQAYTICNWKKRGLICREGETYKEIYSFVRSVGNCNQCSVKFNDEILRCMDHCHKTGFFRQVLCNKCNLHFDPKIRSDNKLGHRWISLWISKSKNRTQVLFTYKRKGFKTKKNISLTKMIAYSFIQLLKVPI